MADQLEERPSDGFKTAITEPLHFQVVGIYLIR